MNLLTSSLKDMLFQMLQWQILQWEILQWQILQWQVFVPAQLYKMLAILRSSR